MALTIETKAIYQLLSIVLLSFGAKVCAHGGLGARRALLDSGAAVFDVTKYGAKGDGSTDDTQAFIKAWAETCKSTSTAKLLVPSGKYLTGELSFNGPCCSPMTIEIQGTLLAKPDAKAFAKTGTWIYVISVNDVTINGGGTLNGQGEAVWKTRALGEKGTPLPDSLVIANSNNSAVENVNIINSKGFHMKVFDCENFIADNLKITAPGDSPNTDGIHIGRLQNITISNSIIGVGDDCVSIGDGSVDVKVHNVTCGPGHGISIGSLGRYQDEKDVTGISVTNCTLFNTTNGARIKTFRESPAIKATDITFEDIIMKDVLNPIIIDQNYASATKKGGSNVKISGVHFRNIRGTTISNIAVSLNCSQTVPCEGIELANIDFQFTGNTAINPTLTSACEYAKTTFTGKMNPAACA